MKVRFRLMEPAGAEGGAGGGAAGATGTVATGGGSGGAQGASGATGAAGAGATGTATLAEGGATGATGVNGTPPADSAGKWPSTWREDYAGTDAKKLNVLARYATPQAALDAMFAGKARIESGELLKPLPPNATPEQLKEYREARGIPLEPKGYEIKPPEGRKIEEGDKASLDVLLKHLHNANAHPDVANAVVAGFYELEDQMLNDQVEYQKQVQQTSRQTLQSHWGPETKANLNIVSNFLNTAPQGLKDKLLSARTPEGVALGDDAQLIMWLNEMARVTNPTAALFPAGGGDAKTMENELNELKKMMGDPNSDYWKGPKKESLQARFRQLVTAQEGMRK